MNGPPRMIQDEAPPQVPQAQAVPGGPQQWGRGGPSSGSGPWLIHKPPQRTLVIFDGATEDSATVRFQVPVPDSRLRVGVKLLGRPGPGQAVNFMFNKDVRLWLYAADENDDGGTCPVTNLIVAGTLSSEGSPVAIPADGGLGGFGREVVTTADFIEGVVTVNGTSNAVPGQLVLRTRYQPEAGAQFSWDEWVQIRSACNPSLLSPAVTVG